VSVAVFLEFLDLAAHLRVRRDLARAVDLLRDLVDLVPERVLLVVDELEVALLLAQVERTMRRELPPRPCRRRPSAWRALPGASFSILDLRRSSSLGVS